MHRLKRIRNRALFAGCMVVAGTLLWHFRLPAETPAHAALLIQEQRTPLEPVAESEAAALRVELGLDDDVLIALNADASALVAVLSDFRGWYEVNAGNMRAMRQSIADQRAVISQLESASRAGQEQPDQLRQAAARLSQLEDAFRGVLIEGEARTRLRLDEQRLALVQRMQSRKSISLPFRGLTLSEDQESRRRELIGQFSVRIAAARTEEARVALHSELQQNLETALGAAAMRAINQAAAQYAASSERVVAAIQEVFPPPEDRGS